MQRVVIIGAGGFGREVLDIFEADNKRLKRWEILGFIDENPRLHGEILRGYEILGGLEFFSQTENSDVKTVVAVGEPAKRKKIVEKARNHSVEFCNIIHPSLVKSSFVEFGKDVIVTAGCIFTNNIKIGNHVIINLDVTIGHDTVIEDFVTLSPGVHISGLNHISKGVYIGTGAVTIQKTQIGEWSTIGAGAVVVKDIPKRVIAVGVPAKPIKEMRAQNED
jgi:sugar O-acyltransferase (sialic acid O-acetyltransferase NeuD family)